ncbi:MAG: TetR/AcrR family transcriptional regulator [Candidatus Hodarchaeales archaeon]|jgi:AcrR family transcriptional regulator
MPKVMPEYKDLAKKRIIEGAYKVFREKGYHQTKMNDIADQLGYSKATLYSYFMSKEELFVATFEYRIKLRQMEVFSHLEELDFLATEDFFEKLHNSLTNAPLFSSDVINESRNNAELRRKLTVHNEKAINRLLEFFEEQKSKRKVKKEFNSTILAMVFLALRDGFLTSSYYGFDYSKIKETWIWITKLFLDEILVK